MKILRNVLCGLFLLLPTLAFASFDYGSQVVMQNAAIATGNGTAITTTGYGVVAIDIIDSTTSFTIVPELLFVTSGTFRTATCYDLAGTSLTSFTSAGAYRCTVTGSVSFRARISAITAGAGSVTVRGTPYAAIGATPTGGGTSVPATSCTNQVIEDIASGGAGTCVTITSSYVNTSVWTGTAVSGILKASSQGVLATATVGTDYVTGDSTNTLTNKTLDCNGTGNACSNIELTTDTIGSYVASVATTSPITGGAAGSEGATLTIACASCIVQAYSTIQDEASALTQRSIVNFTGAGVSCVDNVGSTRTDCTIAGSGGAALSAITAATGANTIANGNNTGQIWNWANITDGTTAFTYGETTAATGGTSISGVPNQVLLKLTTLAASTQSPLSVFSRAGHVFSVSPSARQVLFDVTSATPIAFANDIDTGIGSATTDELTITAGGTAVVRGVSQGLSLAVTGTANSPAIRFATGGGGPCSQGTIVCSGIWFPDASNISFAARHTEFFRTRSPSLTAGDVVAVWSYATGEDGSGLAKGFINEFRKSRGIVASPTAITTGDNLVEFRGYGYVGATNGYQEAAYIIQDSAGTISDSATGIGGVIDLATAIVGAESALRMRVDNVGHVVFSGTAPSMGACGTTPSVVGNDMSMEITIGTGGVATSCAVTFANAWLTNAPQCIAESDTDIVAIKSVETTTTATFTVAAAFTASSKLEVLCFGRI